MQVCYIPLHILISIKALSEKALGYSPLREDRQPLFLQIVSGTAYVTLDREDSTGQGSSHPRKFANSLFGGNHIDHNYCE